MKKPPRLASATRQHHARTGIPGIIFLLAALLLSACSVSPETQAKIDQYNRTIPSCDTAMDCQTKWARARTWALENSDYPIYTESETRIRATSTLTTTSGVGVVISREGSDNKWQILVDVQCFSAGGCGDVWDAKLDFNRTVNGS